MRLNIFLPGNGRYTMLGILGPTWRVSPARRIVQSVCLIGFLALLLYVCWPYGSRDYAAQMQARELIDAEAFLALDPLLSISTAIAARAWVWSLSWAAVIVLICLVIPRGFCGYVCPLGTLIDIFDWAIGRRVKLLRIKAEGWWANLRYFALALTLISAAFGLLLSGFVAAIPVVTRSMVFVLGPLQLGLVRDWYLVPPMNAGHFVSISLFLVILSLGLLRQRFWCRYICPTGALFSLANFLRLTERKVEATCVECGKCSNACSFGAIGVDYTTRALNCTFCQSCGGVCPARSINFTGRWDKADLKPRAQGNVSRSRRSFIGGMAGAAAAGVAAPALIARPATTPVRPPGSVPEEKFLQLCIRCGECFKACPNNVLQPIGFDHGFDGLWTPQVVADWAGCDVTCNNCGQVCPTGAIRALAPEEKRAARIALAIVNERTCLPYAGREDCRMCVDECTAAGYNAIEFERIGGEFDADGSPIEGSGYLAPVVLADKCVGCGLCQMRCHSINVKNKKLLEESAIRIQAGPGCEDRITSGSYLELQKERAEKRNRDQQGQGLNEASDDYLPDFLR
ncbi:MAG: 4Fe-4S dicluster domain-containing protein [Planctomycetota bacterium]|jgi:polyferredoxin